MFTVVSTFSGCGGSSLGYKLAGGKVLLAVEINKNAIETYKMNFPTTPIFEGDIKSLSVEEVLERINLKPKELDIFDGSPPCQGFSTVGKRDFGDSRNQLFKEYCRLLKGLQPKVFIMENVSGMIKSKMKLIFVEILRELKGCGYNVAVQLLNAQHYNVPQSRQRVIFMGTRNDLNIEPSFPSGSMKLISIADAIKDCPDLEDRPMKDWLKKLYYELPNGADSVTTGKLFKKIKGTSGGSFGTIKPIANRPAPTLCKSEISVSGLLHPTKPRYLNIHELKRICSFPDDFKFTSRADACERMGNAVMPNFMKAIAIHIKNNILKCNAE